MALPRQPELPRDPKQVEQERYKHFSQLDRMRHYRNTHRIVEIKRLDKPEDPIPSAPRQIAVISKPIKMYGDGFYEITRSDPDEEKGKKKFNVRVLNGKAYPIPQPKSNAKEYKRAYGDVIDFLAGGQDAATIILDWPPNSKITLKKINYLLDLFASRPGLVAELGPQINEFLDNRKVVSEKQHAEILARLRHIELVAMDAGIVRAYELEKRELFKERTKVLNEQTKLPGAPDAADAHKQAIIGALPTAQAKIDAIAKQMTDIESRLNRLEEAKNSIIQHLNATRELVQEAVNDPTKNITLLARTREEGEPARTSLLAAIEAEHRDLTSRATIWEQALTEIKNAHAADAAINTSADAELARRTAVGTKLAAVDVVGMRNGDAQITQDTALVMERRRPGIAP